MGQLIQAHCNCGFMTGELFVGTGFRSSRSGIVYELAYCDDCKNVQSINCREGTTCETCERGLRLYGNAFLKNLKRGANYSSDETYHCPSCKEENLIFVWTGVWD